MVNKYNIGYIIGYTGYLYSFLCCYIYTEFNGEYCLILKTFRIR